MEKDYTGYASAEDILDLLNEYLYAYVRATDKNEEKKQEKNIKVAKKVLKHGFGKKIIFDKEKLVFVFKEPKK